MSCDWKNACRVCKAWLSHRRRERAIRVAPPKLLFPIEFVKNNPEYSYHGFQKSSGPGKARWKFLPKTSDGHVELACLPGLAGPRHGPGPMECVTHGSLQELRTRPPSAAQSACPPAVYLDLADLHCHDICKNLYFFVAFPCSVVTIRSEWEKERRPRVA